MSASREKKQRQGGTPSNKTLTEKQQAEQTRRKTIQYTVIGVVVAVLVAALLFWDSGFIQGKLPAISVGGTNYSVAESSFFYHNTYDYSTISAYGQMLGYDATKDDRDQVYITNDDGTATTYFDMFLQSAMSELSSITALYDEAVKNGMKASDVADSVNRTIDSAKAAAKQYGVSYGQYLKGRFGEYVTPGVFKNCMTRTAMANEYLSRHQDSLTYTGEQLKAYYNEHPDDLDTIKYSTLYFVPEAVATKDADGNDIEMTDEAKKAQQELNLAAAKTKAEDARKALEGGRSVADVISEFEPSSSVEEQEVQGSSTSNLNSLYREWLLSSDRKDGDVNVVENSTSGYFVVMFHSRWLDESLPTVDTRHILIEAETSDGASAPTDEQMAAAKTKAEELLSRWQTGEATEEYFAKLANENSDDTGSNTNGGLYEKIYKGRFVANYDEWLFDEARKPGDTGIVENRGSYYGYHVVYYVKQNPGSFKWMVQAEEALVTADTRSWLEGLTANYTAAQADGVKYMG